MADFFRYNAFFAKELLKYQPSSVDPSVTKNSFRYRGIEVRMTLIMLLLFLDYYW